MPGIFNAMSDTLLQSDLGGRCRVTMDGQRRDAFCIVDRRQQLFDIGDSRQFIAAATEISLDRTALPRRPAKGDIIDVLEAPNALDIGRWKVDNEPEEPGSGMIRCPVSRVT